MENDPLAIFWHAPAQEPIALRAKTLTEDASGRPRDPSFAIRAI